ncbi:MAG: FAD-dependent oxidoreductase [Clostridia bacterium]|nr:FAD-dependent oxidoreductase [Clostridia bacterium]
MKKSIVALALIMCMIMPAMGMAAYTPGEYTAEAQGFSSAVKATVTVDGEAITAVALDVSGETQGFGAAQGEALAAAFLEKQSAEIDGVSGVTLTSNAAKAAVQKALDEAAGAAGWDGTYTAGTYTGVAAGKNGEMTVEVTFTENAIADVKVVSHKENLGLGYGVPNAPIDAFPGKIVADQTLAIDVVTNATVTGNAIIAAVADAVAQAGGDPEVLKAPAQKAAAEDQVYDVDVVVVGAGAAGLSAAITAQEAGANVLLLEKGGITGGSTVRSGGKILAAGTPWQEKQGYTDNADMMYEYLMSFDRDDIMNEKLVRAFCDASAENLQWLEDRGVMVQDVEYIHSSITPWRVHNTMGGGGQTSGHGGQFTAPLTNLYADKGGKTLYNCCAEELITNEAGAVVGVKATMADGSKVTVNAKGVILCTGGYAQNPDMLAKYSDFLTYTPYGSVPMTNTGDGLTMAVAVGAKNFDAPGLQLVYVSYDCYCGINEESGLIVSEDGLRVVDEYTYQSHVATALADAKSTYGFYIAAKKDGMAVEPYPMIQWGVTMEHVPHAATIGELAGMIGVDAAALEATVARYNELCAKGVDEDFGKPAQYMIPVEGDEYYAFRMTPGTSVTFGGLEIDVNGRVLDTENKPIPGLYAAGEVAFTGLFDAEYPCCGMAIGSAVYYGRVAAMTAIAE